MLFFLLLLNEVAIFLGECLPFFLERDRERKKHLG